MRHFAPHRFLLLMLVMLLLLMLLLMLQQLMLLLLMMVVMMFKDHPYLYHLVEHWNDDSSFVCNIESLLDHQMN